MATNSRWTVVFDDRSVMKHEGDGAETCYENVGDDAFWNQASYSNLWAIQYNNTPETDEVEYRDETPHSTWASTGLDFQPFIDKWDAAHLAKLQEDWDHANIKTYNEEDGSVITTESVEDQTARMGPRPTSYSS